MKSLKSLEDIEAEAERIRKEIEARKSSYAAAIEVAELAELVRDLAHHLVKKSGSGSPFG
jgi:adenylosuccinate lyase